MTLTNWYVYTLLKVCIHKVEAYTQVSTVVSEPADVEAGDLPLFESGGAAALAQREGDSLEI